MARTPDPNARIKLLGAAEAVFVERGLDEAKVAEITARAGLSKGAFYLHFQSKDEAFRQLLESVLARLAVNVDPARYRQELPPGSADLQPLLDRWLQQDLEIYEYIWANRGLMRLLLDGGRCSAYSHLIHAFADRAQQGTEETLAWGQERGLYRPDLDTAVAGSLIAGGYDRLARGIVRAPKRPGLEGLLAELQHQIAHAVGTPRLIAAADSWVSKRRRT